MSSEEIKLTAGKLISMPTSLFLHTIVTIASIVGIYYALRGDVGSVTKESATTTATVSVMQEKLEKLDKEAGERDVRFEMFLQTYNRDMDRYIRNPSDRGQQR